MLSYSVKAQLVLLMSFIAMPSVYAQGFSNSSLDKKLGADRVVGTFVDPTGQTGGAIESASTSFLTVVIAIAALIGFVLVSKGLYDMYTVSKQDGSYTRPLVTVIVGAALAILPVITFFTSNTVQKLV